MKELPTLPRYRLLVIDESHNLRNRSGQHYKAILDYIDQNDPRVILLTATPYNKHFLDLSNQLRLFLDEGQDLHLRPERFFREWVGSGKTEADFVSAVTASIRAEQLPRGLAGPNAAIPSPPDPPVHYEELCKV
jgi:hypothetical protein